MKRILAVLLAVTLSLTAFGVTVTADNPYITKNPVRWNQKLVGTISSTEPFLSVASATIGANTYTYVMSTESVFVYHTTDLGNIEQIQTLTGVNAGRRCEVFGGYLVVSGNKMIQFYKILETGLLEETAHKVLEAEANYPESFNISGEYLFANVWIEGTGSVLRVYDLTNVENADSIVKIGDVPLMQMVFAVDVKAEGEGQFTFSAIVGTTPYSTLYLGKITLGENSAFAYETLFDGIPDGVVWPKRDTVPNQAYVDFTDVLFLGDDALILMRRCRDDSGDDNRTLILNISTPEAPSEYLSFDQSRKLGLVLDDNSFAAVNNETDIQLYSTEDRESITLGTAVSIPNFETLCGLSRNGSFLYMVGWNNIYILELSKNMYVSPPKVVDETGKDLIQLSEAEGEITATYYVRNIETDSQDTCVVMGIYDSEDRLQKIEYHEETITKDAYVSATINPSGYTAEGYQLKVLLVNNLKDMQPLTAMTPIDPFEPYKRKVPEVVEVLSTETQDNIVIERLVFRSRQLMGMPEDIYAIITRPAAEGEYPAMLVLHGGGGFADFFRGEVEGYARNGYAAMTLDMPGIAIPDSSTDNSSGYWKTQGYSWNTFTTSPNVLQSTIFSAETAALLAFNLLASKDYVDETRMGVIGDSWGGYSSTMLAGMLGDRAKVAFSFYGCGFFDLGTVFQKDALEKQTLEEQGEWLKYLDAGRRAHNIKAYYMIVSPTNDYYFWPTAVNHTLNAIPGDNKNIIASANDNHGSSYAEPASRTRYNLIDYILKDMGDAPMKVENIGFEVLDDGSRKVTFTLETVHTVGKAAINYAYPDKERWNERTWTELSATLVSGKTYEAILPAEVVSGGATWMIYAEDNRGTRFGGYSSAGSMYYKADTEELTLQYDNN